MHRLATRFSVLPGIAGASVALLIGGAVTHSSSAQAATSSASGSSAAASSYDLDVASFNISGVMADKSAPYKWTQRRKKVAQQLTGLNGGSGPLPDVVALQEANTSNSLRLANKRTQYQDVVAWMSYYAAGKAHYATIDDNTLATRITYNSDTLALESHSSIHWDRQDPCDGDRYMPYAVFRIKATGDRFFFGSDHLETCNESVRRAQWNQLLDEVPDRAGGLPTIFAGDFNSPRGAASGANGNPTASVMLPRMDDDNYRDTMGQVRAGNAYVSQAPAQAVTNGYVNSVNKFKRTLSSYPNHDLVGQSVDYIFASDDLAVKKWGMVFDASYSGGHWSLDGVIPSDHNMIRATITIP